MSRGMRPVRAEIDAAALRHNAAFARRGGTRVVAVLKADAYGHGIAPTVRALSSGATPPAAYAVASLAEALDIRQVDAVTPVFLLAGFFDERELPAVAEYGLWPVIHYVDQVKALNSWSAEVATVWVKVNSGLNRLGFRPTEIPEVLDTFDLLPLVSVKGLVTHLATPRAPDDADGRDERLAIRNLAQARTRGMAGSPGRAGLEFSLTSSASILALPPIRGDWRRPGLLLFGVSPFTGSTGADFGLRPVMTLSAEIVAVQHVQRGEFVGYGRSGRCERDTRVGVLAVGYGDGYPRALPEGWPVLIDGRAVPRIGDVCMDLMMVDLTDHPTATVGDRAVLWGPGLPVEQVARAGGYIPNELLSRVAARVPRLLV